MSLDNRRADIWRHNGRLLGYPQCCIDAFCANAGGPLSAEQEQIAALGYGFIPCKRCAIEVASGLRRLASLINNRDVEIPAFPNG